VKLVWSRYALSDRDAIFSYIEAANPRAAVHIDEQIVVAVRRLIEFPESGRPGRIAGDARTGDTANALCRGLSGASRNGSHLACAAWRTDLAGADRPSLI
jgi:hypothetical protein